MQSDGFCSAAYEKPFALLHSDNKHKLLVENWSDAEERGALAACPRKVLVPRPLERRKMYPFKIEYSAGFRRFRGAIPYLLPKFAPLLSCKAL